MKKMQFLWPLTRPALGLFALFLLSSIGALRAQTVPFLVHCPTNIVVGTCGTNRVVQFAPPTAAGGCAPYTVVCVPPSGSTFPAGTTPVTCRVVDHCNHSETCTFTVTVRRDTTPPLIRCPADIVRCETNGHKVNYNVAVSDNLDPTPDLVCVPPSGSVFPLGVTAVKCQAVDRCGNTSRCEFSVTIVPDDKPILTVTREGNYLVVYWTKTCTCYQLQASRLITQPIIWADVHGDVIDLGTRYAIRLPNDGHFRYFRLVQCDRGRAPIFEVISSGLSAKQADSLADVLKIPRAQLSVDGGEALFIDPKKFQAVPTRAMTDPAVIEQLTRETEKGEGKLEFEALDFAGLSRLRPPSGEEAIKRFEQGLRQADLLPANGEAIATHTLFDAVDEKGKEMVAEAAIDTQVYFNLQLGGVPLIGPGASIRMAFSPGGEPTGLQYAMRELKATGESPIIPPALAARRCAELLPELPSLVEPHLVYFAPPLSLRTVKLLLPYYECSGSARVGGELVEMLRVLVPAIDDPALVPQVILKADAKGITVSAQASVTGGQAPYSYRWLSSSVDLSSKPANASSIDYRALPRGDELTETVRVIVTDANGVQVQAIQIVTVAPAAGPVGIEGGSGGVGGVNDFGIERAVSNLGAGNQAGFNSRFLSEGVTRRFNWTGANCWELDFREGVGGLDHLYVDNADIVFYIGHGNGGGFTFESMHNDGKVSYNDVVGAWGDNDLEWLALLSCQVLKDTYDGKKWYQRWGPAFNGLHLLLGFETNAHDWDAFGGTFADWMLGRFGFFAPMPVRTSWFLAKAQQQPASNIAVVMGVIGPANCSNYNDYFWSQGSVGPDIRGNNIKGYWRVRYQ